MARAVIFVDVDDCVIYTDSWIEGPCSGNLCNRGGWISASMYFFLFDGTIDEGCRFGHDLHQGRQGHFPASFEDIAPWGEA